MKLFSNNPKALGNWGFVVDDSSQKPKLRTTKLKLGEQITIMSIKLGTTLTNIGKTDLHLYKGKTTSGNPLIIHTGEQAGMQKGFSTITVINPSMLETGAFTATVNA